MRILRGLDQAFPFFTCCCCCGSAGALAGDVKLLVLEFGGGVVPVPVPPPDSLEAQLNVGKGKNDDTLVKVQNGDLTGKGELVVSSE